MTVEGPGYQGTIPPSITCPYCEREAVYPGLEDLFSQPGTVEEPKRIVCHCAHCDLYFRVEVPGGPTGGWKAIKLPEDEQEAIKLDGLPDPDGGVDESLIEKADAVMRDLVPNNGFLNDDQAAKFAAYLEEGMREEWEAELAAEAGVRGPLRIPLTEPVPIDHVCCPMCRERGQFPEGYRLTVPPEITGWRTGDCAFPDWGDLEGEARFSTNNWTCGAMSKIRDMAAEVEVWSEDQHVAILPWYDQPLHLVVSYYKHRGRTEGLHVMEDGHARVATYQDVVEFLHATRCGEAMRVMRCRDQEVEAQWEAPHCDRCGRVPQAGGSPVGGAEELWCDHCRIRWVGGKP